MLLNKINIYFLSVVTIIQLSLVSSTLSLFFSINMIMFIGTLLMIKLIISRNHFLNYLIIIEVFMVMIYASMLYEVSYLSSSSAILFLLMVVMVAGACVGMSLLVVVTRMMNKELELSLTSM